MAFLISGANTTSDAAYSVANSCRFNDDDDARISRTLGTATNIDRWTMSCWVKRCTLGANSSIFTSEGAGVSSTKGTIRFDAADSLSGYLLYEGGWKSFTTNELFRDVSAWYHIVVAVDTTDSTATNRMKVYVNGTQITSFATYNAMDQNADTYFNDDTEHQIGSLIDESEDGDMYLSEFVFIDGTQYAASDFGEFNEDTPTVWQPKDVSGLTFGDNGCYLDFEASDNLGNDANGGTDWGETNLAATDQTTDTPTLNYMTLNPLSPGVGDTARIPTFSEGNTKFTAAGSDTYYQAISTFGVAVGQWYFEVKVASDQDLDKLRVGYWNIDKTVASGEIQDVSAANSHVFYMNKDGGEMRLNTTATTADYGTFADDELMGVAIDMDAQTITILKANSVIVNAYDYSGGIAAGTVLTPAFMGYDDTAFQVNFGNPHEANSSDAADENGYGAFEFAPPSGYLAFNSANLGSDGG